jgi:HSP20 family molecular chaperone IbpA
MRTLRSPLFTTLALALVTSVARADDWEKLGTRVVAFAGEKDTIDCTGEGLMNAIKIDVDDGNLEMYNVKITFQNGDTHSPDTRYNFDQNTRSRTIDLPGDARAIRKIEFWYRSKFQKGRATVTVFGRKVGGGAKPGPDPRNDSADDDKGWELLGTRLVDFGGDKDTIEVTASEGRFKQIKIDVESGNVDMWNIRVTFGDGEHFSPETRVEFREGSMSRTIDLPGDARVIRKVEFWYKSELRNGKGRVRLYGKQSGGGGGESPKERWEKLGTRVVDFGGDRDVIEVGAIEGRFDAIKLDVDGGNLDLWNIRVEFGDGTDFSPETRVEFRQGSMSRTIDLPGDARVIRKVVFHYKSELKRGKATLDLFGRHAGGGGGAVKPPPQKDPKDRFPGWEHLGSRVVDFGGDHDVIDCRGEGKFGSFQIEVENGDLEMFNIKVTFMNGDTVSPPSKLYFDENTRTRLIDLPGKDRAIKRIEFWYKSVRASRDGKATVNVYGKR